MKEILSCSAPYNEGGLGKILAQLVEEARLGGRLNCYYAGRRKANDPLGREIGLEGFRWLFRATPLRRSLAWRDFVATDLFDRAVARKLELSDVFLGFPGRSEHSFKRARQLGNKQIILEAATSHIANVVRQHRKATATFPIEKSWLNRAQVRKVLREYDMADLIYVHSEYSRQTFLEAGVPEAKMRRRFLQIEARFAPPIRSVGSGRFTVVYVGRLQVTKGLPVLIKAFARLADPEAELVLVGGSGTDQMDQYLKGTLAGDRRIKIRPGDPLPWLHRADVLVHPSFEDGLGFAPLEALACGVPVLVTEDTGMKEYVVNGENGYVLSTGDADELAEHLSYIRGTPLKGKFTPLSLSR